MRGKRLVREAKRNIGAGIANQVGQMANRPARDEISVGLTRNWNRDHTTRSIWYQLAKAVKRADQSDTFRLRPSNTSAKWTIGSDPDAGVGFVMMRVEEI